MPKLHTIWIGPPRTMDIAKPKMDLNGLLGSTDFLVGIERWNNNHGRKHQLYFWCLEPYLEYYQKLLNAYTITVSSCEDLLKNCVTDTDKISWVKSRLRIILRELAYTSIVRCWVTAKNILSLAVLYFQGGYYLDSTVYPLATTQFPEPNKLRVMSDHTQGPYGIKNIMLTEPTEVLFPAKLGQVVPMIDIYFMSSKRNDDKVLMALYYSIALFRENILEVANNKEYTLKTKYTILAEIVMTALINIIYSKNPMTLIDENSLYQFQVCRAEHYLIQEVQVVKRFNGTHKADNVSVEESAAFSDFATIMKEQFIAGSLRVWDNRMVVQCPATVIPLIPKQSLQSYLDPVISKIARYKQYLYNSVLADEKRAIACRLLQTKYLTCEEITKALNDVENANQAHKKARTSGSLHAILVNLATQNKASF